MSSTRPTPLPSPSAASAASASISVAGDERYSVPDEKPRDEDSLDEQLPPDEG